MFVWVHQMEPDNYDDDDQMTQSLTIDDCLIRLLMHDTKYKINCTRITRADGRRRF